MTVLDMFMDAGFEKDLFNNEQKALDKAQQVFDYCEKHGKAPPHKHEDAKIRALHVWLIGIRSANKGKRNSSVVYPSLNEMAKLRGFPDIFKPVDRKSKAFDKYDKVVAYYKKHNKYPLGNHKDKNIVALGMWLCNMRRAKAKLNKYIFYKELEEFAIRDGLPDMFDSLKSKSIQQCKNVIEHCNKHGRCPSSVSKNKIERVLGIWLVNIRLTKHKRRDSRTFYEDFDELATKAGLPNLFNKNYKDDFKKQKAP